MQQHINSAVKAMKEFQWDSRGKMQPLIYDLCCGAGRCIPYYKDHFPIGICLHDHNKLFLAQAQFEVSRLLSSLEHNHFVNPTFVCNNKLDQIEFPPTNVHFIFANFAFENLRDNQLEPTIRKCLEHLHNGGIIFIKEPYPEDKQSTQFDFEKQRFLRAKQEYKDILKKWGCQKVKEFTQDYSFRNYVWGKEFVLIYRKCRAVDEMEFQQDPKSIVAP